VNNPDDDLIRELSTPIEDLDPATREQVEHTQQWAARQRATGQVAPASETQRHPFPIGLDDTLTPFPLTDESPRDDDQPPT
jgi:hypothetical protein